MSAVGSMFERKVDVDGCRRLRSSRRRTGLGMTAASALGCSVDLLWIDKPGGRADEVGSGGTGDMFWKYIGMGDEVGGIGILDVGVEDPGVRKREESMPTVNLFGM